MRIAIIVAHPDDEIIWAGGLILKHPQWRWTVLSLCRSDDAERSGKFQHVCSTIGITGIISNLDDGDPLAQIDPRSDIGGRILDLLPAIHWDLCLTHGSNGEYGHPRHRQVSREVVRLVHEGAVRCSGLWQFAYDCDAATGCCRPAALADRQFELTRQELAEKKRIIRQEYGFADDSFEVKACISPESFQTAQQAKAIGRSGTEDTERQQVNPCSSL